MVHPSTLAHFSIPSVRLADGASLRRCVDIISEAISTEFKCRNSRGHTRCPRVKRSWTPVLLPCTSLTDGDDCFLLFEDIERRNEGKSIGAGLPDHPAATVSADATDTCARNVSHDTNIPRQFARSSPPRVIEQTSFYKTSIKEILPLAGISIPNGSTHDKDVDSDKGKNGEDVLKPIHVRTLGRRRPKSAPARSPWQVRPILDASLGHKTPHSHKDRFVKSTSASRFFQERYACQHILRYIYSDDERFRHAGKEWEGLLAQARTWCTVDDAKRRGDDTNVGHSKIERVNAKGAEALELGEIDALPPTMAIPVSRSGETTQIAEMKMTIKHSREFRRAAVQLKVSTAGEIPSMFRVGKAQTYSNSVRPDTLRLKPRSFCTHYPSM